MRNTFRLTHQIFPRTLSNKISSTDGQQTEKQFHIRQQRYRLLNHARETINSIDFKIHQCGAFQFLINGETINTIVIRNIFMIYKYSLEITLKYTYL